MEYRGIAADVDYLHDLQREFADGVAAAAAECYAVIGREVNLGSPKQLQAVIFDELGLPKTKKNKTGYTTDADALTWLFEQTGHPFMEHLLRHRDVTRLRTVIDGLLPMVDDGGRIHTTFQQTIAATGRLSSTDPNLQNIPIRTAEGRRIRQAFVVGQGYESLMTADYSQIEMRIMAHLSGDEGLIEAFTSGEDLHSFVASRAFDIPIEDVDPEMRRRIKAMSYGLAYGLCAYGLAQQLRITPEEARGQMHAYFERFGGIRDYLDGVVDEARLTGYTETTLGRRRYLPDLTSDNRQRREMAERMALNAPIQGSAADVIKVAMLNVEKAIAAEGLRSRMLLQVHDELVLEVAPGEREKLEALVRREMAGAAELSVAAGGLGRLRPQLGRRRALSRCATTSSTAGRTRGLLRRRRDPSGPSARGSVALDGPSVGAIRATADCGARRSSACTAPGTRRQRLVRTAERPRTRSRRHAAARPSRRRRRCAGRTADAAVRHRRCVDGDARADAAPAAPSRGATSDCAARPRHRRVHARRSRACASAVGVDALGARSTPADDGAWRSSTSRAAGAVCPASTRCVAPGEGRVAHDLRGRP